MRLVQVLDDIAKRLLLDDWELLKDHALDDPSQWDYVLGIDAFYRHQSNLESPPRAREWSGPRPGLAKYLRGLVAAHQSDYVNNALKRFRELGFPTPKEAYEIMRKVFSDKGFAESLPPEVQEAAIALFDALRIKGPTVEDPPFEYLAGELERARDRQYLRELALKYEGIVAKSERLNPLQFSDAQLQEATRCWLYGFYRATVVLSASALESFLKRHTRMERFDTYEDLISAAEERRVLQAAYVEQARRVLRDRNKVVHDAANPSSVEAQDALVWVRGILATSSY